ncbi:MAG: CBS domain-containing protein [Comamonadaceae bacterium]|jgi:acetoin utilization protein AcuB|nr:CBS domain-containing protein [Comamonadaceae bacterium]
MLVRNRMSRPAVTVRQDAEFQKALALMQEKKLRRLPVVDDDGRLVGIVVERDLLVAAMRYLQSRVEIGDIMTRNVVTVSPDADLVDVARTMLERKIGGLPVVEDGRLVGIVTESDIFRRFVEMHG